MVLMNDRAAGHCAGSDWARNIAKIDQLEFLQLKRTTRRHDRAIEGVSSTIGAALESARSLKELPDCLRELNERLATENCDWLLGFVDGVFETIDEQSLKPRLPETLRKHFSEASFVEMQEMIQKVVNERIKPDQLDDQEGD